MFFWFNSVVRELFWLPAPSPPSSPRGCVWAKGFAVYLKITLETEKLHTILTIVVFCWKTDHIRQSGWPFSCWNSLSVACYTNNTAVLLFNGLLLLLLLILVRWHQVEWPVTPGAFVIGLNGTICGVLTTICSHRPEILTEVDGFFRLIDCWFNLTSAYELLRMAIYGRQERRVPRVEGLCCMQATTEGAHEVYLSPSRRNHRPRSGANLWVFWGGWRNVKCALGWMGESSRCPSVWYIPCCLYFRKSFLHGQKIGRLPKFCCWTTFSSWSVYVKYLICCFFWPGRFAFS